MVFRFIRQMSNTKKETIRRRLAMMYAIIAWNGFAICLYSIVKKDKEHSGLPLGLHEAVLSESAENVKVFSLKGLSFAVEESKYEKEEIEEARKNYRSKLNSENDSEDF